MDKRGIQAFSAGILFASSLMSGWMILIEPEEANMNSKKAKEILLERNFVVLSKDEFNAIKQTKKAENDVNEEVLEENNQKDTTDSNAKSSDDKTKQSQKEDPSKKTEDKISEVTDETKVYTYTLQVLSGMNSKQISSILLDQNIIENQKDFELFLVDKGYYKYIQIGTYTLSSNMTYDEIGRRLTKK